MSRTGHWLLPAVSVAAALLVWEGAGWLGMLPHSLPPPHQVVRAGVEGWRQGFLWRDIQASLGRVLPGLALGATAGVAVGLVSGRTRWFAGLVGPLLHLWRAL